MLPWGPSPNQHPYLATRLPPTLPTHPRRPAWGPPPGPPPPSALPPHPSPNASSLHSKELKGHSARITGLHLDLYKAVTATLDGTGKVWDLQEPHWGALMHTLRIPPPPLGYQGAYAPYGGVERGGEGSSGGSSAREGGGAGGSPQGAAHTHSPASPSFLSLSGGGSSGGGGSSSALAPGAVSCLHVQGHSLLIGLCDGRVFFSEYGGRAEGGAAPPQAAAPPPPVSLHEGSGSGIGRRAYRHALSQSVVGGDHDTEYSALDLARAWEEP